MSVDSKKIGDWAKKCGYTGPIPKDMSSFLNESTLHIWNEIITKVKPRNEVEDVHRKVISHRLKVGMPLNEAMPKEYDIYRKMSTLNNLKEATLARIAEKEALLKKSETRIRQNRYELVRIKTSNEAIEIRTLLLEEKTKSYTANIATLHSKSNFIDNSVFLNKELNLINEKHISDAFKDLKSIDLEKVGELLHSHRNAVFNEIHVSEKNLLQDLCNTVGTCENISTYEIADNFKYNDEKFGLYAKCLEHDLDAKMLSKSIENLQSCLQTFKESYKNKLLSQGLSSADVEIVMKRLEKQAKLAGLDNFNVELNQTLTYLRDELTLGSQNSKELEGIRNGLQEINQSMASAIKSISSKADKVIQNQATVEIAKTNSKTALEMLFGIPLDYLMVMECDVVSKELMVFRDYPIEYYKQHKIGAKSPSSILNTHLSNQPCSSLLSELHTNPLQTSWELLTTIHNDLRYLTQLSIAAQVSSNILLPKIDSVSVTTDFGHNTDVVQKSVNELKTARSQLNLPELRSSKQKMQQSLAELLELKFGAFLSPDKVFAGKSYIDYEEEFMRYYNML